MSKRAKLTAKRLQAKRGKLTLHKQEIGSSKLQNSPGDHILHLQRTIGNRAVSRLLKSGILQAKLKIGRPGDIYEKEADRVADQVMRMPMSACSESKDEEKPVQAKPLSHKISPAIQKQAQEEEEEEEVLQPKGISSQISEVTPDPESTVRAIKGRGEPLPPSTRAFFEPRFGYDFSQVRVYTGSRAAEAARTINARAFTVGRDVVLGSGEDAAGANAGQRLLAHELTHVVQQGLNRNSASLQRMPLTEEEKKEDLKSPKYAGNPRLEKAFDNNPALGIGERGDGVRLVQEGLVGDGFYMPRSTKSTGQMDGIFGSETFSVIKRFQAKHGLSVDGVVGHETMGKLDQLALVSPMVPPGPVQPAQLPICPPGKEAGTSSFAGGPFYCIPRDLTVPGIPYQIPIPAQVPGVFPRIPSPPTTPPPKAPTPSCPPSIWPPPGYRNPEPTSPSFHRSRSFSKELRDKLAGSYAEHNKDKSYLANAFWSSRDPNCPATWPRTLWKALDIMGLKLLEDINTIYARASWYPYLAFSIHRVKNVWSKHSNYGLKFQCKDESFLEYMLDHTIDFCRDTWQTEAMYHGGQKCWREVGQQNRPGLHVCLGAGLDPDIHMDRHQFAKAKDPSTGKCLIDPAAWLAHTADVLKD